MSQPSNDTANMNTTHDLQDADADFDIPTTMPMTMNPDSNSDSNSDSDMDVSDLDLNDSDLYIDDFYVDDSSTSADDSSDDETASESSTDRRDREAAERVANTIIGAVRMHLHSNLSSLDVATLRTWNLENPNPNTTVATLNTISLYTTDGSIVALNSLNRFNDFSDFSDFDAFDAHVPPSSGNNIVFLPRRLHTILEEDEEDDETWDDCADAYGFEDDIDEHRAEHKDDNNGQHRPEHNDDDGYGRGHNHKAISESTHT